MTIGFIKRAGPYVVFAVDYTVYYTFSSLIIQETSTLAFPSRREEGFQTESMYPAVWVHHLFGPHSNTEATSSGTASEAPAVRRN